MMKILIADDHQLFIDGMQHILRRLDTSISISQATTAEKALALLEYGEEYDLILIDLRMPGMDGMSILQRVREQKLWLPIVVVSAEEDLAVIKAAVDAGALGFIPKTHSSEEMIDALQSILNGDIYIPKEIEKKVDSLGTRRPPEEASINPSLKNSGITRRQYDVLRLLAKGYSNKQIATTLFLTEHTVKAHLSALFITLKASNRTECVQVAIRQGIVALES